MDNPQVFNNYDIRGACPKEVNEELAERLGKAIGTHAEGLVVVGGDTRDTTPNLKKSLIEGIRLCGCDVIDVGTGPTDLIAVAGTHYGAKMSVMVTASHHGWNRNGFKLMYKKGNGFSNEDLAAVKKIYIKKSFVKSGEGAYENRAGEFKKEYLNRVVSCFKKHFSSIDAKVVVDCANGATSIVLPELLCELSAEVIKINCETKQDESINPEPDNGNRCYLTNILKENNADIVVGCDIDGDRVFAYDSNGWWITGDEIFTILAKAIDAKKITASLDTSTMLSDVMATDVTLTRVGDIFVSKKAIENNSDFLGEPNGHYAFPEFSWYNSGTFAALILCAVAKKIPKILENFPKYTTISKKFEFADNNEKITKMEDITAIVDKKYEMISDLDGVKYKNKGAVVLIRPSGTKALIRVSAEGKNKKEVIESVDSVSTFFK